MSECVVRMEMPNGCHDCKLRNMVGNCPIPMFYGQYEEMIWTSGECFQRPSWCPIICSLPEGHGRLVDADVLNRKRKHLIKTENGVFPKSEWFIKANDLFAAKTIVPAERSEHEAN